MQKPVNKILATLILLTIAIAPKCFAQNVPDQLDLYLLIGQSNMAGRGKVDSLSKDMSGRIWYIDRKNQWLPGADPLHSDKPAVVGVGPGLAFAQEMAARHPGRTIGLIPCAVGGSGIDDWTTGQKHGQTGIYAYDEMLERVKEAQKRGKIKAILWHQGEADSSPQKSAAYAEKLEAFLKKIKKETGTKRVPVVVGTLGDFYLKKSPEAARINQILAEYAKTHKRTYIASSIGLTDLGDQTHFDTKSARELGRRYAEALEKGR